MCAMRSSGSLRRGCRYAAKTRRRSRHSEKNIAGAGRETCRASRRIFARSLIDRPSARLRRQSELLLNPYALPRPRRCRPRNHAKSFPKDSPEALSIASPARPTIQIRRNPTPLPRPRWNSPAGSSCEGTSADLVARGRMFLMPAKKMQICGSSCKRRQSNKVIPPTGEILRSLNKVRSGPCRQMHLSNGDVESAAEDHGHRRRGQPNPSYSDARSAADHSLSAEHSRDKSRASAPGWKQRRTASTPDSLEDKALLAGNELGSRTSRLGGRECGAA